MSRLFVLQTPLSRLVQNNQKGSAFATEPRRREHHALYIAAERSLHGFALGRKAWLFAGSDRGADRAAAITTLIMTAKLNDVDPQTWLADVLARIADAPQSRLHELLPWEWKQSEDSAANRMAA